MKRIFMFAMLGVLLASFIGFAIAENQTTGNTEPTPELYTASGDNGSQGGGLVCTQEAKLCPDGSYVSRNSNNGCKFDACPSSNCICPSGYIADGNVCNPKCYYSQPRCLAPSIVCKEDNNTPTEPPIVGASCGTVTPGYQNECCVNKGYSGWDSENFTCIGENVQENGRVRAIGGILRASAGDNNENESNDSEENNTRVACPMDAKICPDGTTVGRTGEDCEFKCPKQYNISKERVCCKIYGYGTEMNETNVLYRITDKKECTSPENFVGGNREIVNNSYCINEIQEKRQEFLDKKWEILQERNRIKSHYLNQSECPDNCTCTGSTVKCEFENGTRVMTVYAGKSGNIIVQVKNINASTNVTLYKSDGKVYGIFMGNDTHEIILPDDIKEIIKQGKRINWTEENITLNGTGFYHVEARKHARLFWVFPVKEKVHFEINSETGEITKTKTMWWGFLAKDVEEKTNSSEGQ
jgi:hypothetical protein